MDAPEGFRSLASIVLGASASIAPDEPAAAVPLQDEVDPDRGGEPVPSLDDLLSDVRLFRAQVRELVDEALNVVLGDVAAEVLGRELQLAPASLQRIADSALKRYFAEKPLRIRVHPADAGSLVCDVPVDADPALRPGDAVIELQHGWIDATLGVRLQTILQRMM